MSAKINLEKELKQRCTELEKQVKYYKNIAQQTGQKRLREVEMLNNFIAERKKSEKALRDNEQRFRLIAQSTNDIFYEWDIESNTLQWFGNIDSTLGYKTGEIKHTFENWLRLIHPDDRHLLEDTFLLHKESIKPVEYSYRVRCKDGSIRYWNDNSSPVLDQEGKSNKWVGGISDITERKEAEEALIQAQRLGAIGELASGIAHDFNNSLQGILGNIELALLKDISPEVRDYLETVKKSSLEAASRISQLQRFSGKGKSQTSYKQMSLNGIIDDMVAQTRPLWKDESEKLGITIEIEKNYAAKELTVDANAEDLRFVLYNLIKNSVQSMRKSGKLTFKTGETETGIYVTVTDTGTGMDEEIRARVLQPFFTTKGFEQGKGLGMSTSYAIVKEHGGDIHVKQTALDKGTSIEIILPYSRKKENRPEDDFPGYKNSAKVLWVDDEEVIRDMGKALVKALGHSADVAASGEEALRLLLNNQYDLMITDVGMPNMSGWQLAEKIKGNYPEMKVAVVTGWGTDVSKEEKEKYGVCYVLGKPIDMGQLEYIVAGV
ncbi:MAG: response regulator [Dissulfuribacterales bacterium]